MSILDMLPGTTGRGSTQRESEVLLTLVASGLVGLSSWQGEVNLRRPYDDRLQLGLDRLAVACARTDSSTLPTGIADLVWEWCATKPMRDWPLVFDPDAEADGELLLVDGEPSEFCREWVRATPDVVGDVHESALVRQVKDVAKALGRPELYAHWRLELTRNTLLSPAELIRLKNRFLDAAPWAEWIDESYEPVPSEGMVDGQIAVCRGCRQWMTAERDASWKCPSWRCAQGRFADDPEFRSAQGAFRLRAELVRYIALPGLPELELAEALARLGARVVLYPGLDALDVVAIWPSGFAIGVDVKDWRNPYLLARSIKRFPEWTGAHPYAYSQGYIAVPTDRTRGKDRYLRILGRHSSALSTQPQLQAVTIDELISRCPDEGVRGEVTCGP
ncbi:hypothetical protein [Streptomyces kanamyceticus]|nr:hypothetical protein [Streptomyces kanamyceticus]